MIREVYKDIYQIGVELPNNPLQQLNTYLIKGEDRSLLIDTGFNREECKKDLFRGLEELNIDLDKLDIFITHLHADHSGLINEFADVKVGEVINLDRKFYASQTDGFMINDMSRIKHWEEMEEQVILFDIRQDDVTYNDHPAYKFCAPARINFTIVREGDIISVGEYKFEVIEVPGHTPGQVNLFEREHKIYISGDHILDRITPNISFWGFDTKDLHTYFESLEKVRDYDIDLILPSHRMIMNDHPRRVDEIIQHHRERLEEVFNLMESGKFFTVREITANMTWRIRAKNWDDFPPAQKWFASGEAMAHLEYFYNEGKVERKIGKTGQVLYKKIEE